MGTETWIAFPESAEATLPPVGRAPARAAAAATAALAGAAAGLTGR